MAENEKTSAPGWITHPSKKLAEMIKRDMEGAAAAIEALKRNPSAEALAAFERSNAATMSVAAAIEALKRNPSAEALAAFERSNAATMSAAAAIEALKRNPSAEALAAFERSNAATMSAAAAIEALNQNPSAEALAAVERGSKAVADAVAALEDRSFAKALQTASTEALLASTFAPQKALPGFADSHPVDFPADESAMYSLPELPPVEETPLGRTMIAVEALTASAKRMEGRVDGVTQLAARVAELISNVITEIRINAQAFQEQSEQQTRKAIIFAKWSIGISVLALAVSAGFSIKSYLVQRQQLRAESAESAQMLHEVHEQNAQLRAIARGLHTRLENSTPAVRAPLQNQHDRPRM